MTHSTIVLWNSLWSIRWRIRTKPHSYSQKIWTWPDCVFQMQNLLWNCLKIFILELSPELEDYHWKSLPNTCRYLYSYLAGSWKTCYWWKTSAINLYSAVGPDDHQSYPTVDCNYFSWMLQLREKEKSLFLLLLFKKHA